MVLARGSVQDRVSARPGAVKPESKPHRRAPENALRAEMELVRRENDRSKPGKCPAGLQASNRQL